MDLVPYVEGANTKMKAIQDKAKSQGRQLTMLECFEIKALEKGVDMDQKVQVYHINEGTETPLERRIREYLEEKTGLKADLMRIQADRMAVRLFIPEVVYLALTQAGTLIPSEGVRQLLATHGMDHQMRFKIHLDDEMWVPIISTYAKMFEKNKLAEFDYWINEMILIRDRYMSLTQKRITNEDQNKEAEDN